MVNLSNIVCKTVGIAGMSAVIYDSCAIAKHHAGVEQEECSNDVFEKSIAAERSTTNASHITSAMQKKVSNFRINNPIVPIIGKTIGFTKGFISALGDNIIPVTLSSIALAAKGTLQKFGAWGLGIYAILTMVKEGFGVGKTTPIDE